MKDSISRNEMIIIIAFLVFGAFGLAVSAGQPACEATPPAVVSQ